MANPPRPYELRDVPETPEQTLKKRGVRTRQTAQRNLNFVGRNAKTPFLNLAAKAFVRISGGDEDFATFGTLYSSGTYRPHEGDDRQYEDVYGENDWTIGAQDPEVKRSLDQAFGNLEGEAGGEIGVDSLLSVLGRTGAKPNIRSIFERGRVLAAVQSLTNPIPDDSTTGVRGIEDVDGPLEPFR